MTNTQKEVRDNKREANAPARKTFIETVKTVLIVALVVGVSAFIGGIHYQQHVDNARDQAVTQAVKSALTLKN